jgi:hypothetical protein
MDPTKMELELRPLHEGAYTRISLRGPVVTRPSGRDLQRLLAILTLWHGDAIDVVLSVAGTNADIGWAEIWEDGLRAVPVHHARVRIAVRGINPVAPIGHER